jgi:exodeoxyribonuclease VII large subunit
LLLYPVAVQGANAVPDILKALHYFHQRAPRPDVIIIARGGGSIEDLWAFHDEMLVRAVANSTIPIISAIGHETDTTLIDYASDYRAPTPTAAAEIVLPLITDLHDALEQSMMHLRRSLHQAYGVGCARFNAVSDRFKIFETMTLPLEQRLDDVLEALKLGLRHTILQREHAWALAVQALGRGPFREMMVYEQSVQGACQSLRRLFLEKIHTLQNLMTSYQRLLAQLSYQKTLERGFALVLDPQQKLCASKDQAMMAKELQVRFFDGCVPVYVQSAGEDANP